MRVDLAIAQQVAGLVTVQSDGGEFDVVGRVQLVDQPGAARGAKRKAMVELEASVHLSRRSLLQGGFLGGGSSATPPFHDRSEGHRTYDADPRAR